MFLCQKELPFAIFSTAQHEIISADIRASENRNFYSACNYIKGIGNLKFGFIISSTVEWKNLCE